MQTFQFLKSSIKFFSDLQNVNNLDMRLRKFMESFNGVATKYLQNYLNWFLVLEKIKNATNRMAIVTAITFASNNVWEQFNNISNQYVFQNLAEMINQLELTKYYK